MLIMSNASFVARYRNERAVMKTIIYWLFPQWEIVSKQAIELHHISMLLGGKQWTTREMLEVQQDRRGRKRAFLVSEYGRKKVDYDYIMTMCGRAI